MPVTIIAEMGVNHDGKLSKAIELAIAAKIAGADIVKTQTYVPAKSIRRESKDYALLESLALSFHDTLLLAHHCQDIGIEFCSTPDDIDSLKFLVEECGVKRIKIGSGSLFYRPLVDAAFDTGLPILLSTGMATFDEVEIEVMRQFQRRDYAEVADLVVMHCTSLYPCPPHLANVGAIKRLDEARAWMWKQDHYEVGFSDHTESRVAAMVAVGLGATVIEKHFTLSPNDIGPDHHMSIDSISFQGFVKCLRSIEVVLGNGVKSPSEEERAMIPRVRKDANGLQPGI